MTAGTEKSYKKWF